MKYRIILALFATAAVSSCSTVYRSGQTPDDVYFSPGREGDAYVQVQQDGNRRYQYQGYSSPEDRYLRMKVHNPALWSTLDDYNYYNNDYLYYNNWAYNSPGGMGILPWNTSYYWNNYWYWNSYYNPYCYNVVVVSPKSNPVVYSKVRNFSLNSYTNNNYYNKNTNRPSRVLHGYYPNTSTSNGSSLGNSLRKVLSGNNSNSSYYTPSSGSSGSRPSRTYTPPSSSGSSSSSPARSSSSGSSSSGSTGGSVHRPTRGGGG